MSWMTIDVVVEQAAGLDIGKASLAACVRAPGPRGGWRVHKRKSTTMTGDLLALAEWLAPYSAHGGGWWAWRVAREGGGA